MTEKDRTARLASIPRWTDFPTVDFVVNGIDVLDCISVGKGLRHEVDRQIV
jgi:hypothetical protein